MASSAASTSSPVPGARSTSRSTSLSMVSSPRATEPKTRRFDAPWEEAARLRARRCCTTRRPSGPVNRARAGAGLRRATASSRPVAATRRVSVGSEGCRAPASYALITLCVTPARRASSAWVSPERRRASRSSAPGAAAVPVGISRETPSLVSDVNWTCGSPPPSRGRESPELVSAPCAASQRPACEGAGSLPGLLGLVDHVGGAVTRLA
jgi:hypothetical protein